MAGGGRGGVERGRGLRPDTGQPGEYSPVEADAGRKDSGRPAEYELHGRRVKGCRWEVDDNVELSYGAGCTGAVECGAAISVSRRAADSEGGFSNSGGYAEYSECSAGPKECGAAISVSGRTADRYFFVLELWRCEASAAGRIAGFWELGVE